MKYINYYNLYGCHYICSEEDSNITFDCINENTCIPIESKSGKYNTMNDCLINCICKAEYDCINDTCVKAADCKGTYSSLNECKAECCKGTYNCINDNCVKAAGCKGTFSSLDECKAECCKGTYNCINGNCVKAADCKGTYSSLNECKAGCCKGTYDCINDTCVKAADCKGTFSSLDECKAECCKGTYNCINGNCVKAADCKGTFSSLDECKAECCKGTYNCINGNCVKAADCKGTYSSLNECKAECCKGTYDCINGNCVKAAGCKGTFSSLDECEAECCKGTYDCINGNCVKAAGCKGTFSSLDECEEECQCKGCGWISVYDTHLTKAYSKGNYCDNNCGYDYTQYYTYKGTYDSNEGSPWTTYCIDDCLNITKADALRLDYYAFTQYYSQVAFPNEAECDTHCKAGTTGSPIGADKKWYIQFREKGNTNFEIYNHQQNTTYNVNCYYQLRICRNCDDCTIVDLSPKAEGTNFPVYKGAADVPYKIYIEYKGTQ